MRVLTFVLILFVLASCKTTQYVPVETTTTKNDTVVKTRIDTVKETDKEFVFVKGDTVFIKQTLFNETIREVHDTVVKEVAKKMPKPYKVTETKEVNVLYWWQKLLMYSGVATILILLVYLGYKRYKKR